MTWAELDDAKGVLQQQLVQLKQLLDYSTKQQDLQQLNGLLKDTNLWQDPQRAKQLAQQASRLEASVQSLDQLSQRVFDLQQMIELASDEKDASLQLELTQETQQLQQSLDKMEFQSLFNQPHDHSPAFLRNSSRPGWDGGTGLGRDVTAHVFTLV